MKPSRTALCRWMLQLRSRKERLEAEEMLSCRMDAKVSSHGMASPSTMAPLFAIPQPSLTGLLPLHISVTHTMLDLTVFTPPCSCCACALSCTSQTHAHAHARNYAVGRHAASEDANGMS